MAIIELQDPLSTEIQSPTIAGTIEALNRISAALDLNQETLEKVFMHPVGGLEPSDPRRIYQVDSGNRLWLAKPTPVIYVNDSEISDSSNEFTIDYIGGSITFTGEYRPNEQDIVSVSCSHISPESQVYVGSELEITFSPVFYHQVFTVTGGNDESYSGVVDSDYKSVIRVKSTNTTYTISADTADGKNYTTSVEIGPYYGQYRATLSAFSASIKVTAVQGATVKAVLDDYMVSGEAGSSGVATLTVSTSGNYNVNATYGNAGSNTKSVQVSESGREYTVSVEFITLTVTAPEGSTITVKNGDTTLSETGGTVKFYLPNTGTWTVTAELGGETASSEVQATEYKDYPVELSYIPETLNDATWAQIHELSASGKLALYFDDGDTKDVVLNGTVGILTLNSLTVSTFILGINHNSELEGENLTHFAIGKINGKQVALCDSQYNDYTSSTCFHMNSSNDNGGGWNQSYMRKTILGNSGSPSSPPANSLLAALPADLRAVMQSVNKYTDNTGNGSNSSGAVTATVDWLWLLAEFELNGSQTYANQYERNSQQQYDYFKAGNPKTFGKHNATGTVVLAWSRSPRYYSYNAFVIFYADGTAYNNYANYSGGLFAGFAV